MGNDNNLKYHPDIEALETDAIRPTVSVLYDYVDRVGIDCNVQDVQGTVISG